MRKLQLTMAALEREINATIDEMATADDSQREYMVGSLSALLWVQAGGDVMRPQAFGKACEAWDKAKGLRT